MSAFDFFGVFQNNKNEKKINLIKSNLSENFQNPLSHSNGYHRKALT